MKDSFHWEQGLPLVFFDHHGGSMGTGAGGQFRIQLSDRINTEWYLDSFFLGCFSFLHSQELETRKHLVGGTATISTGFQIGNDDINIYVHGLSSFYPEPKVSIDG